MIFAIVFVSAGCADDAVIHKNAKQEIVVSGIRAFDMALRLKYAGIPSSKIKIIKNIKQALNYTGKTSNDNITILPTYTALLALNKIKNLKNSP